MGSGAVLRGKVFDSKRKGEREVRGKGELQKKTFLISYMDVWGRWCGERI